MRTAIRSIVVALVLILNGGFVRAEQQKSAPPAMAPAKQAVMEAMQKAGSPSEGHKALEPFVGSWSYTAQWWMSPDAPPETMTGTATNSLMYGGRFLKQEINGQSEGQPPFEGIGFTGYDNLRKEYQSVWLDNMATGMMMGAGQFDATTKALTDQGEFSCPVTMETHRKFRAVWTVVDPDHNTYQNYMSTPDGREYKAMEIHYSRTMRPCPAGIDRC